MNDDSIYRYKKSRETGYLGAYRVSRASSSRNITSGWKCGIETLEELGLVKKTYKVLKGKD